MPDVLLAVTALSLIIWIYLICCRSGFWRADTFLSDSPGDLPSWPEVIAIVPARDETEVIGRSLSSLLSQDYPGSFSVTLVDDHSTDDTITQAEQAAESCSHSNLLTVLRAGALPSGWTGKIWALSEGLTQMEKTAAQGKYIWFTDADIEHDKKNLRGLVAKAEHDDFDMVSLMAILSCQSFWERLLLPPFVFFFQKLYPFPRVNVPLKKAAAGAGGCMLIRAEALRRAGGLKAIRNKLIDDCALARLIKTKGRSGGR
jgi:hopene-associated glycosyltransferase HpnB